ncbi:MAG TPA: hypothetical protein VGC22_09510 [Chitinophaga sp.]
MKQFLMFAAVCTVLVACKKDSSSSKPSLSFANYSLDAYFAPSSTQAPANYLFSVTFNVADADGDITDTIALRAHYKSKDPSVSNPDTTAWLQNKMPDIGANKGHSVKGQVQVDLLNTSIIGYNPDSKNDSLWFSAYIRDAAGHYSDTILTPKIPIIKE